MVQNYEVQLGLNAGDVAHFTWKGPSSNPTDAEQTARRSLKATWQLACGATRSKLIDRYDHVIVQSIRPAEAASRDEEPNKSEITWSILDPLRQSVDINKIDRFFDTPDRYNLNIIFEYVLAQDKYVKNYQSDAIIHSVGYYRDNYLDIQAKATLSSHKYSEYFQIDHVSHFCLLTLTSLFSLMEPWNKEILRLQTEISGSLIMRSSRHSAAGSRTAMAIEFFRSWGVTEVVDVIEYRAKG